MTLKLHGDEVAAIRDERTSALLIRVWIERDPEGDGRVVIRVAARTDVESDLQQSAVFGNVASASAWVERWLSKVVARCDAPK